MTTEFGILYLCFLATVGVCLKAWQMLIIKKY